MDFFDKMNLKIAQTPIPNPELEKYLIEKLQQNINPNIKDIFSFNKFLEQNGLGKYSQLFANAVAIDNPVQAKQYIDTLVLNLKNKLQELLQLKKTIQNQQQEQTNQPEQDIEKIKNSIIRMLTYQRNEAIFKEEIKEEFFQQLNTFIPSEIIRTSIKEFYKKLIEYEIDKLYNENNLNIWISEILQNKRLLISISELIESIKPDLKKKFIEKLMKIFEQNIINLINQISRKKIENLEKVGETLEKFTSKQMLSFYLSNLNSNLNKTIKQFGAITKQTPHIVINDEIIFTDYGKRILLNLWKSFRGNGQGVINAYLSITQKMSNEPKVTPQMLSLIALSISNINIGKNYKVIYNNITEPLLKFLPEVGLQYLDKANIPKFFKIQTEAEEDVLMRRNLAVAEGIDNLVQMGILPPYGSTSSDRWFYVLGNASQIFAKSISGYLNLTIQSAVFPVLIYAIANSDNPLLRMIKGFLKIFFPAEITTAEQPLNYGQYVSDTKKFTTNVLKYLNEEEINNFMQTTSSLQKTAKKQLLLLDSIIEDLISQFKGFILDEVRCLGKEIYLDSKPNYALLDLVLTNVSFKQTNIMEPNIGLDWEKILKSDINLLPGINTDYGKIITKTYIQEGIFIYPRFQILISTPEDFSVFKPEKEPTQTIKVPQRVKFIGITESNRFYSVPSNLSATQAQRIERIKEIQDTLYKLIQQKYAVELFGKIIPLKDIIASKVLSNIEKYIEPMKYYLNLQYPENEAAQWSIVQFREFFKKNILFEEDIQKIQEINKMVKGIEYLLSIYSVILSVLNQKPFEIIEKEQYINKFIIESIKLLSDNYKQEKNMIVLYNIENLEPKIKDLVDTYLIKTNVLTSNLIKPKKGSSFFNILKRIIKGNTELNVTSFLYIYLPSKQSRSIDVQGIINKIKNLKRFLEIKAGNVEETKSDILLYVRGVINNYLLKPINAIKEKQGIGRLQNIIELTKELLSLLNFGTFNLEQIKALLNKMGDFAPAKQTLEKINSVFLDSNEQFKATQFIMILDTLLDQINKPYISNANIQRIKETVGWVAGAIQENFKDIPKFYLKKSPSPILEKPIFKEKYIDFSTLENSVLTKSIIDLSLVPTEGSVEETINKFQKAKNKVDSISIDLSILNKIKNILKNSLGEVVAEIHQEDENAK